MKVLHTADWHLGKSLERYSRLEEQERFLQDFVDLVEKNEIDVVLIAGDIYDSVNPPAKAEKLFYDTLKKISFNGERLTVIIAGNHDNPERLAAAGPLAMEHGIIIVGTPKSIVPIGRYGQHRVAASGEGFIEIEINKERAVILTVPYPSEKRLEEVLYGELDTEEERLDTYTRKIQLLFQQLSKHFREDTINLVVSHLFAMGSEEAGSERSIQLGGSYIVSKECFPQKAQYVALGHIHKPQIVPGTNGYVRYSGSPLHYSKSEINYEKKCIIIELKAGEEANIEEIPLDVYKPIEIWCCKSVEEAIEKCIQEKDRELYAYLEIQTDRFIREDEIKAMKSYIPDILEVMPVFTNKEERQGRVEIKEKDFLQLFHEFYKKENGVEVQEETVNMLLDILKEE